MLCVTSNYIRFSKIYSYRYITRLAIVEPHSCATEGSWNPTGSASRPDGARTLRLSSLGESRECEITGMTYKIHCIQVTTIGVLNIPSLLCRIDVVHLFFCKQVLKATRWECSLDINWMWLKWRDWKCMHLICNLVALKQKGVWKRMK